MTESPFPPKTLADLDALPRYKGKPQPIDAISRLSNEDILRLLSESGCYQTADLNGDSYE